MANDEEAPSNRNLYFCVVIVNIIYFGTAASNVWSSPAIPRLEEPGSRFHGHGGFSEKWLVSFFAVGQVFGPLISGCLVDTMGRKPTTFIIILFLLLSYVVLAVAPNALMLYIGRIIGGFAFGMSASVSAIYVAEISDASNRETLNFMPSISRSLGYLLMYAIGPYVNYLELTLVSIVAPVMALLLFFLLPESPYHLFAKGKTDKAEETIEWLRKGAPKNVIQLEIDSIQKSVEDGKKHKKAYRDLFSTRASIRAMCISCGLLFFLQMSGTVVVMSITETLFDLAKVDIPTNICTLTFGVLKLVAGVVGSYVTGNFGVKGPLIISALGMSASLVVFGGHFYCISLGYDMSSLSLVPLVSLVAFICIYSIGLANRAFAVAGELFAPNVKALGSSLTNCFGFACAFLCIQLYYKIESTLGIHYGIWCFALINALSVPFVMFFVPNTSGLSLPEIQELLSKPWFFTKQDVPLEKITIRRDSEVL